MKLQHLSLEYEAPRMFQDEPNYDCVKILKNVSKSKLGGRALIVLDHMPSEDLESKRIFSGVTGETFLNQVDYLENTFPLKTKLDDWSFLVISYNMFKTYHRNDQDKLVAKDAFAERLKDIIKDYKPDYVLTFGNDPFYALNRDKIQSTAKALPSYWYGRQIKTKIGKHEFYHIPNLSYNTVLNPRLIKETSYTLGYMARWMLPMFQKGMPYKIPKITCGKKRNWKLEYLTDVKSVLKLIKKLRKAPLVAVDTETENLNRIKNKLLTTQFSMDGKTAYVVPFFHRDSPFTPKELRKLCNAFKDYFEENENFLQIYVNAKFDLNVMRSAFGIRSYCSDVWDVQAGEFGFDENAKSLTNVIGAGYYNLENLTMQYGCNVYSKVEFGKEQRATINDVDLDENVQEYAALDVIIPFHIYHQQIKRAKDIKYEKYEKLVGKQISDQIHAFSVLESTGAYTDIDYLFKLNLPDSPINAEIASVEQELLDSPEVRAANGIICKDDNVPKRGLRGAVNINKFDISKSEHKQILFFDVMKLTPLAEGKKERANGKLEGKLDKDFQSAYKENPVVKLYTKMGKAHKLRNAYVRSLLKLWGTSDDFRHDRCIRPQYSYLKVVTGRTSASDPNLQQIPSRSEMGKHIKRLLISRPGRLMYKVDFSAHEVRGWSIISGDKDVAEVFEQGRRLRDRFKMVPDSWIHHMIDVEGDVHKINASYFFGIPIMEVTKPIRDAVKTVIFGLIYQQGDKGLAKSTGRDVKEIADIKAKFLDRFPVGLKWFGEVQGFAQKNYFVESPIGRRRHLWGYMLPDSHEEFNMVFAACERRAVNSPVQGFGSDIMMIAIRRLDRMKYEYWKANGNGDDKEYPDFLINVSVHDSITVDTAYRWMWLAAQFIEASMTSAAVAVIKERFPDFDMVSDPEMDFEIGSNERDVVSWDFSFSHYKEIVEKSLIEKRDMLGESDLDVEKTMHQICETQYDQMPEWMQKQLWANDIKIESRPKRNPLSESERKQVKEWLEAKPANEAKYEAYVAEQKRLKAEAEEAKKPKKKRIKFNKKDLKRIVNKQKAS